MIWSFYFTALAFAIEPATYPIFLKMGFSSVLEFSNAPKRVVSGDSKSFQVERMDKSLVVRTLVPTASGNLLVFFDREEPMVFVLTAAEEAEPTLYRKFDRKVPPPSPVKYPKESLRRAPGLFIHHASFDKKLDYLTIEAEISADSGREIQPDWDNARIQYKRRFYTPTKLWAERKEVHRDGRVNARLVFTKPDIPMDLKGVTLLIPQKNSKASLSTELKENK